MIPSARDLWTKIKLSGFCQPVWNRGPGNSEPQQGTLDQEAGQGQGVTGRWVLDRSASTAGSWFRIPRESKNVLCYFPFLDPIKIMSLLANKKKKKRKAKSQYFEPHYSGTVNKWSSQATWWVFLKERPQWDAVRHRLCWGKDAESSLGLPFHTGPSAVSFWVGGPAPVDIFLASHRPLRAHWLPLHPAWVDLASGAL